MMIRSFIALELPVVYQSQLSVVRRLGEENLCSKIRWTKVGNWHLTMAFLGEQPRESLDGLQIELKQVSSVPFACKAGRAGFFYGSKGPRVLWLGLEKGARQCAALGAEIFRICHAMGLVQEKRAFKPHLTLGRIRRAQREDDWSAFFRKVESLDWPEFQVSSFALWKSVLQAQGPVYSKLAEFSLG